MEQERKLSSRALTNCLLCFFLQISSQQIIVQYKFILLALFPLLSSFVTSRSPSQRKAWQPSKRL